MAPLARLGSREALTKYHGAYRLLPSLPNVGASAFYFPARKKIVGPGFPNINWRRSFSDSKSTHDQGRLIRRNPCAIINLAENWHWVGFQNWRYDSGSGVLLGLVASIRALDHFLKASELLDARPADTPSDSFLRWRLGRG